MSNWQPPQKRSTLLDDIPQSGFKKDALMADYSTLKKDESIVFRILTFEDGEATQTPARKCYKAYKDKEGNVKGWKDRVVPDPGHPYNQQILDDNGVKLGDCDNAKIYRTPVIYLYRCDTQGNIVEEVNEVRYLEYTAGVAKQFKELQDDVDDGLGFEAIPDYDTRLKIVDNNGIKNYEIKAVRKVKNGNKMENCSHFGVGLEEAVGDEFMAYVVDSMPALLEHMQTLQHNELQPDAVKEHFLRYREDKPKEGNKSGGAPNRPNMPSTPSRNTASDDESETGSEEESPAEPKAAAPVKGRFPALKPKS